jgi:preprotein translocase subunit Sss1
MPQEMGLPAQPQAPPMEDRLMGFAEYTNSDDPDMPLPQIMPTSQVSPTEQLSHNTDLVEMYTHWSAVMKESFGTNPRDWPQRGRDVLSGISDAILDETPPPSPEVEMPPEEEPSRRRFMRPSQSSELVEGLPPGGWGSHSENISVSEYRHLAALEEYPLRRSLDRMTPDQKTSTQKLAVASQDERMVVALENPSWLKLDADDEEKQAAERMEEMIRERGKPLTKWRKPDREEFSVLSRKVGTAMGSFHGVRSGGSMSNPSVVARHIRAHLKQVSKWNEQVSKWNARSEEESKPFMQKWAENMPVD